MIIKTNKIIRINESSYIENIVEESKKINSSNIVHIKKKNIIRKKKNYLLKCYKLNILNRFFLSLIPLNNHFHKIISNSSSLLFVFIIYICISFILVRLIIFTEKDNVSIFFKQISFPFSYITLIIIVFFNGFAYPFFISKFLNSCYQQKVSYIYLTCLYGYSVIIFIPILILYLAFNKVINILLFFYGICSSLIFRIINLFECGKNFSKIIKFTILFQFLLFFKIAVILFLFDFKTMIYYFTLFNSSKKQCVNIAVSSDFKFRYPILVLLTSLMENIGLNTFYKFFVMVPNDATSVNIKILLHTLIPKYGRDKLYIKYIHIKSELLPKNLTINGHISKATYNRLLLPELIPEANKIIYIDSDVINFKDLSEMYNYRLSKSTYFMGVLDNPKFLKSIRDFGIYNTKFYINAGIIIINLKSMREFEVGKKIINFAQKHTLQFWDQTAINAVCGNNIKIMPLKYNYILYPRRKYIRMNKRQDKIYKYTDAELFEGFNKPVNLHYITDSKPWIREKVKGEYWWYYAKKTGFLNEIITYTNYKKEIVDKMFNLLKYHHEYILNYQI